MKRFITGSITLTLLIAFMAGASVQASPSPQPESPAAMCNNLDLKNGPLASVGYDLAALYCEAMGEPVTSAQPGSQLQRVPLARIVNSPVGTLVVIDTVASGDTAALKADLEALGLQNASAFGPMVSGQLPVSAIADMAALPNLRFARASVMVINAGLVTSQGDNAMKANTVRTAVGVDGTGITVGTLSDSYDCMSPGSAATDVGSGDLPAGVNVLQDLTGCPAGTDEGRAMMQLIHDVAPGSSQAFHSASVGGMAGFATGIVELARDANCDVIVDDVIYLAEPMFQDGIIAQAVFTATNVYGASYFSSSGNQARQSYEANYSEGLDPLSGALAHDFDTTAGTDYYQQLTLPASSQVTIIFQWAQPYASATGGSGATTNLDICFDDGTLGDFTYGCTTANNVGGDPIEGVAFNNPTGSPLTFNFSIIRSGGAAFSGRIKYVYYRSAGSMMTVDQYATNSGTCYGHANAATAEAVGAAFYGDTPVYGTTPPLLESFSSAGPTTIYYNLSDNPVTQTRQKPGITAPDGTNTTFFGSDIGYDPDSYPNFFGTSAAAPHAAAVAALLLDYDGSLSSAQQYDLLRATAIDMGTAGVDYDSGYGLIQADFIRADFSDLAASYGYAYHAYTTTNTLRLGSAWTDDTTFAAGHDDASDDGVVRTAAVNWTPGGSGSVDVTVAGCGGTCRLNAWVDWNNDGNFAGAGEQILTNQAVANGSNPGITFAVPGATPACYPGTCNARFRLSTASGTGITGSAADGEVEDYAWNFGPNAVSVSSASANPWPKTILPSIAIGLCIFTGLVATTWLIRRRRTI